MTFSDLFSFRLFLQEGYKEPLFGPTKRKTVCSLSGGNFNLKDFSIQQGVAGHVMQL